MDCGGCVLIAMPRQPGDMAFSAGIAYFCCKQYSDKKEVMNWELISLSIRNSLH